MVNRVQNPIPDRTVVLPPILNEEFDATFDISKMMQDRVTQALDREFIDFLKRHNLYDRTMGVEANREHLKHKGYEVVVSSYPNQVYKFRLCKVVDFLNVKIVSDVSVRSDGSA